MALDHCTERLTAGTRNDDRHHAAPAIATALERVDEAHYRGCDGRQVRQTTPASVIARHLPLLDVHSGMRILEIGTGSGYTAALLTELTGPNGSVVSVDVDPDLTQRADELHHQAGFTTITTLAGDGYAGAPDDAPYDRLIAWTTPPHLPAAWTEQVSPDGVIVAPLACAPIAYSTAMARTTVTAEHTPGSITLHRGQYVPMTTPHLDRARYATVSRRLDGDRSPSYLSAPWLANKDAQAEEVLERVLSATYTEVLVLGWPEVEHLKMWMISQVPPGLTVAARGDETLIGLNTSSDLAFIALFPDTRLVAHSETSEALSTLRTLLRNWEKLGRPSICDLTAEPCIVDGGWALSLSPTELDVSAKVRLGLESG